MVGWCGQVSMCIYCTGQCVFLLLEIANYLANGEKALAQWRIWAAAKMCLMFISAIQIWVKYGAQVA